MNFLKLKITMKSVSILKVSKNSKIDLTKRIISQIKHNKNSNNQILRSKNKMILIKIMEFSEPLKTYLSDYNF